MSLDSTGDCFPSLRPNVQLKLENVESSTSKLQGNYRRQEQQSKVRHIQGLNGRPICMVRDDWCVTSSLFPHPLLKSQVFKKAPESSAFPFTSNLYRGSGNKNQSALFSQAWRDELRDLAAKVSLSSQTQKSKKEVSKVRVVCL
ncbi:hypothetical protein CHARACLAT_004882 [Characodon lateralis]|uniref:Uncharacterized protein n=1 Tax=Characodon lateralis TaxID=208331 RepID=A0ABU7EGE3_9TELE|nr:hypothetical protein [Characodon lateralis]